uniref:Uncharacterized protein n=1 Tax=Schistocephalus solidus TaxID=70667 RepID=A0A0X3NJY4_SCHSO
MSTLSVIRRMFINLLADIFGKIHGAFVRLHQKYVVQTWWPSLWKDMDILESVQHWATKVLPELENLSAFNLHLDHDRGDLFVKFQLFGGFALDVDWENLCKMSPKANLRRHH